LPGRLDPQVGDAKAWILRTVSAPGQRAHAGQQFLEGKRLRQTVVSTEIQPLNTVRHPGPGGQNEQVCRAAFASEPLQDGQPIHAGQHQIEINHVVVIVLGVPEAFLPIPCDIDGVARLAQPLATAFLIGI